MSLLLLLLLACKGDDLAPGCGPLGIRGETELRLYSDGCASGTLRPTIHGQGDLSVRFERLDDGALQPVIAGSGTFEALQLEGDVTVEGDGPLRWWRQGYQSWAWSGVSEPQPIERDARGLPVLGGDGDGLSVKDETAWSSWWVGLLGRPDGASLLMGATRSERTRFALSTDGTRLVAAWGGRGATIDVDDEIRLDPVWLGTSRDSWDLHLRYAQVVADQVPARPIKPRPPVGWATWTVYYAEIDEDIVRDELAAADAIRDAPKPRVFQIDDGWQKVWGDWTANDDFPSGMDGLARDIQRSGLTPGLWMAPFYVDRSTATFTDHPDWWVRDDKGDPLVFTNLGSGDYAIIDASHPAARAWMAEQVGDRAREGWTYLKLDFLYAGAQEGVRHADVTGIEALQLGLRAIRKDVGEDAWILACGAPMLPSVGWADSFRSGADIAFTIQPDSDLDSLRWQTRATAARGWQGGIWWHIDADQVLLRAPFTRSQADAALVANAVSGGAWLMGDSLHDVPDRAWNPELVGPLGQVARPDRPLDHVSGLDASPIVENVQQDDRVPLRWFFPDGRVALLNLSEEAIETQAPAGTEVLTGRSRAQRGAEMLPAWSAQLWDPE